MKQKLSFQQNLLIGSLLFGLFFGAGNLIFPVQMGQQAGSHTFTATIGFLITGVGLPIMGIIASAISKSESLFDMARPISSRYASIFTCLLYLTIGPLFAIPRTATVAFEVGTFVVNQDNFTENISLEELSTYKLDVKDLYEMRLIFEPQTAYYAAKRATNKELERILYYGKLTEEKILNNEDRTEVERAFHKSIAKATHNEFMNKLMPILYKAIDNGVILSNENKAILQNTINDHRMIMEFLNNRDAEGAKTAMKLHIIRAMRDLDIYNE